MSQIGLIVTSAIYLVTAIDLCFKGQEGLAIAFLCYAGANLGLLMAIK